MLYNIHINALYVHISQMALEGNITLLFGKEIETQKGKLTPSSLLLTSSLRVGKDRKDLREGIEKDL